MSKITIEIAQESHNKYGYLEKAKQTIQLEIDLNNTNKTVQDYALEAATLLGFGSYANIKDQLEFRTIGTGIMRGDIIELDKMVNGQKYLLCLIDKNTSKRVTEKTVFDNVNKALNMGKYHTDPVFEDNRYVDESEWD